MANVEKLELQENWKTPLDMYCQHIKDDYAHGRNWNHVGEEIKQKMIAGFNVNVETGPSYYKIVKDWSEQKSVYAFIVRKPNGKFAEGDILKPASWASPAKNFKRGNVFEYETYKHHRWSGL